MPEVTVTKDRDPKSRKSEIGRTEYAEMFFRTEAGPSKRSLELDFDGGVSTLDSRHVIANNLPVSFTPPHQEISSDEIEL